MTSPPRRILMTADAVGGVWAYALELARALAARGTETHLATMGPRPNDVQRAAAHALGVTLHEGDYALEWMDAPWDDVRRAGDWLLGLEAELGPDVVHLNGYAHGALPFRAPTVVVAHSDVCAWWRAVRGEEAPPAWDAYRDAVAAGLAAAGAVVAPTRAVADGLARDFGPRVRTLGGTVDAHVVPNARRAADYPPAPKEPIVLTAGRLWDDAKNVRAVARAAAGLPWPVSVAGDAAPPDGAGGGWQAAPDAGASNVRWLGALTPNALAAWMGRAAVYALPARYEPFGLSALEAGLAGCALVLGDLPSLREVWGGAALFVAPDAPAQLACALRTLAADDGYRVALGARARARALEYAPERMVAGYLDAYAASARGSAPVVHSAPPTVIPSAARDLDSPSTQTSSDIEIPRCARDDKGAGARDDSTTRELSAR